MSDFFQRAFLLLTLMLQGQLGFALAQSQPAFKDALLRSISFRVSISPRSSDVSFSRSSDRNSAPTIITEQFFREDLFFEKTWFIWWAFVLPSVLRWVPHEFPNSRDRILTGGEIQPLVDRALFRPDDRSRKSVAKLPDEKMKKMKK